MMQDAPSFDAVDEEKKAWVLEKLASGWDEENIRLDLLMAGWPKVDAGAFVNQVVAAVEEGKELQPSLSERRPDLFESASLMIRFLARLIDQVILFGLFNVAAYLAMFLVTFALTLNVPGSVFTVLHPSMDAFAMFAIFVAILLYYTLSESIGGASLGKALLGMQVVSDDLNSRCSPAAAFFRALLFPIDLMLLGIPFFLSVCLTKRKKRIGDLAAQTTVVMRKEIPEELHLSRKELWVANAKAMAAATSVLVLLYSFSIDPQYL